MQHSRNRFGALQITHFDDVRGVPREIVVGVIVLARFLVVAEENHNHENECHDTERRAERDSSGGLSGCSIPRGIPDFPQANKNQNQRPIRFQNLIRLEAWAPIPQQKQPANRNQQDGHDQRCSGLPVVLGHCRPPHLVLRMKKGNSSGKGNLTRNEV